MRAVQWTAAEQNGGEIDIVTTSEHEVDSRGPVFFLSYRHSRFQHTTGIREPNRFVMEFFDDLSDNVSELLGRLSGEDAGFMDRLLEGGQRWTPELFQAASTCQIFVPLISPGLLRSEWCGMEWDLFSRRKVFRRGGDGPTTETCILPVVWIPTDHSTLPTVMRGIQRFAPVGLPNINVATMYVRDGLFGLRQMGEDAAYRAVVWRLAQRIADLTRTHRVGPLEPFPTSTDDLRDVFQERTEVD